MSIDFGREMAKKAIFYEVHKTSVSSGMGDNVSNFQRNMWIMWITLCITLVLRGFRLGKNVDKL